MKKTYVYNVSKSEYGVVRLQAHSDEEAEDRLKDILDDDNVDWKGKPEYSWDLRDIDGEGDEVIEGLGDEGGDVIDDIEDVIDNEFDLEEEYE